MIELELVAHDFALDGSSERAGNQKAYLKFDLDFFGVSVPVVRAALKRETKQDPVLERPVLLQLSNGCFEWPYFEMRLLGVLLLGQYSDLLEPEDLGMPEVLVRKCET